MALTTTEENLLFSSPTEGSHSFPASFMRVLLSTDSLWCFYQHAVLLNQSCSHQVEHTIHRESSQWINFVLQSHKHTRLHMMSYKHKHTYWEALDSSGLSVSHHCCAELMKFGCQVSTWQVSLTKKTPIYMQCVRKRPCQILMPGTLQSSLPSAAIFTCPSLPSLIWSSAGASQLVAVSALASSITLLLPLPLLSLLVIH